MVGPPILAAAALSRRLCGTQPAPAKKPACRQNWRPHPDHAIWEIAL